MAIDLLSLQPNKVSRDLSGYITYVYGPPKIGKTTFAAKNNNALIIAFEHGYSALPGVIAQDITSWGEMKQLVRELKKPEVKERFKVLIVDTVDIASDLCQKYLCNQLGIENIGDGGWTVNGWAKYKKEFEEVFRTLAMSGYALFFISHGKEKTIKPQGGEEYQIICPSLQSSAEAIVENMSDIIGYAHAVTRDSTSKRVLTLRSDDGSIVCGCRFRHIAPEVDLDYDALTKALNDAIDKEAEETNGKFVTNERAATPNIVEYDYEALMTEFKDMVGTLMNQDQSNGPKITAAVERYLGKGKKIVDTTPAQAEFVHLIVDEIKNTLLK